ncbi:hypothetical protein BJ508DRAFT_329354 [Ascobolus immersus RN42]|uniref:CCHC-type domain-containing protein n=1 Tax=Ascobolus immersus RN42 TaxID=1160509 RepID=A0A3N4HYZ6_ASCIM|nr:hypothetical protein BJ508DRAFT_329354 [Ascobolus immersus RN42]
MKCAADYIAQLRAIQAELRGSEDALTDRNLLAHLLTHLPGRYRITVNMINNLPQDQQTLDRAARELANFETLDGIRRDIIGGSKSSNTRTSASALSASYHRHPKGRRHRSRSRDSDRRRSRSPRNPSQNSRWNQNDRHSRPWKKESDKRDSNYSAKECTYCHRRGHLAHECRKRIYDERNKQPKRRENDPSGSGSDTTITAGSASVKADAVIDDYFAESDRTERHGFGKQH